MGYEQDLTFQLRLRGRDEEEIADTLRELRAHGIDSASLLEEFGTPEEYAERFEKTKRRTLGARITIGGATAAIGWVLAWIAVSFVRKLVLDIDPPLDGIVEPWSISVGALAIIMIGVVAGFLVDRLRPAQRAK
ncbi:hypothetical protein [Curtobacterium sp. MCBD17_030]|uniref:hypothetical protein n=1 Tax=Curtobacterium sp. MCBD17_030 TaxID=2175649 RepID=UPI000D82E894|nr:hypothetical protein [Curtobacterium sp. MCBD17_030]PYY36454.1 hypothetical protein DEI89_04605 [Curtobacterium sp. MCBD17_030]